MSTDLSLLPNNAETAENTKTIMRNGDAIVSKEASTTNSNGSSDDNPVVRGNENGEEDSKPDPSPPSSSTPTRPKKTSSLPKFVINDEETDEIIVKQKPFGHNRGGSSTSQVSAATTSSTSTCSLSREVSLNSSMAETVSLPLTLEQLKSDTSAQTTSDPALRLTADLSRDDLSNEERHETLTKLLEEVVALKLEIVNLKEENECLRRTRTEMDDELHQLTENLFEEAYKMVDEAKGGKVNAEKRLRDAAGQIEAMETKVSALNNLLHVKSPPSSLSSPHTPHKHKKPSVKKMIRKISRKSTKKMAEHKETDNNLLKAGEIVTEDYGAFVEWLEKGLSLTEGENPFFSCVHSSQITPCLKFKNEQLSVKVKGAIQDNSVVIEPLAGASMEQETFKVSCALTNESSNPCSFRMKLGEEDTCYYISSFSRNKIVAVCDFYTFVGYVKKGIIKKETVDLYWQIARLRAAMSLAVLNLTLLDPACSS